MIDVQHAPAGSAPYRAVLFDFFGTLTEAIHRGPAHEAIARRLDCSPEAFARALNETFFERCVGGFGDPTSALMAVAARAGGHPTPFAARSVLGDRTAAVLADTRLRPDAVAMLREVRRRGLRTALVSDCGPELASLLPGLGVDPLFDARVLSIEVGRHKPDPLMYLTASARLAVRPSQCVYVGDGGSHELSGAAAVGMTPIRLAAPDLGGHLAFNTDDGWHGPHVTTLADLPDLISSVLAARPTTRLVNAA